jgi:hypothetical protein
MWTIRVSRNFGGRRPHWEVLPGRGANGPWVIQKAWPDEHGYRYDPPIHKNIKTKREAMEIKRTLP